MLEMLTLFNTVSINPQQDTDGDCSPKHASCKVYVDVDHLNLTPSSKVCQIGLAGLMAGSGQITVLCAL